MDMEHQSPLGTPVSEIIRNKAAHSAEFASALEQFMPGEIAAREVIRIRMLYNLTQEQLASRIGTTKSAISRLENGSRSPNLRTLERIAASFGGHISIQIQTPESEHRTARSRGKVSRPAVSAH